MGKHVSQLDPNSQSLLQGGVLVDAATASRPTMPAVAGLSVNIVYAGGAVLGSPNYTANGSVHTCSIRSYRDISGIRYYGDWSAEITVTDNNSATAYELQWGWTNPGGTISGYQLRKKPVAGQGYNMVTVNLVSPQAAVSFVDDNDSGVFDQAQIAELDVAGKVRCSTIDVASQATINTLVAANGMSSTTGGLNTSSGNIATSSGNLSTTTGTIIAGACVMRSITAALDGVIIGEATVVPTGARNTVIGAVSGGAISSATDCTYVGAYCGNLATGVQNTAIGVQCANALTSGINNVCIGYASGSGALTTGSYVVTIGSSCGGKISGSYNVAIGSAAAQSGASNISGTENVWIGYAAGQSAQGAVSSTTCIGAYAGQKCNAATNSVFIGYQAGWEQTTGSNNIAIGSKAGVFVAATAQTGSGCIMIGYEAKPSSSSASNEINLGEIIKGRMNPASRTTQDAWIVGRFWGITQTYTPSSASDATGDVGAICWDADYIYVKTAAAAWKRAALSTW